MWNLEVSSSNREQVPEDLAKFQQETAQLKTEVVESQETIKKFDKVFSAYYEKILGEQDKTIMKELFRGSSLQESLQQYEKELYYALRAASKKNDIPLTNLNFTVLLSANGTIANMLALYNQEREALTKGTKTYQDLEQTYDLSKKTQKEIEDRKQQLAQEQQKEQESIAQAKQQAEQVRQESINALPPGQTILPEDAAYHTKATELLTQLRQRLGTRYKHDTNPNNWLDCSWLIYAGLRKLWIKKWMPRVSGDMYRQAAKYNIKQWWFESDEALKWYTENIQPWHLVFWQSTTNKATFNPHGNRVHHVAIVSDPAFKWWKLNVIESNGKQWVTEWPIDLDRIRNSSQHKSKIFICKNPSLIENRNESTTDNA